MLFNSYVFWIFFAVVFVLYRLLPHKGQNYMLLAASYVFYGYWDWRFLFAMLFSTTVDYLAALGIDRSQAPRRRKAILLTSICIQLTTLGIFKYYNFFSQEFGELLSRIGLPVSFPVLDILLPVGISFYTFQTMSYTIDVYRGDFKAEKSFVNYALFVSFFPHLVAGPLVRASKLLPQLSGPRVARPNDFRDGLYYIVLGLFKKVVIADNLAVVANAVFRADPRQLTGVECLIGLYAFAFQIYGDFSGYSSIAQGVAKWLNIDLSLNFRMPYLSVSPADFWSRWHISLSSWFRDYVYVPLARGGGGGGGGRISKWRLYYTTIIVMTLSGLWHGAAWTFILWGLYHGLLLCGYRIVSWPRLWFASRDENGGITERAAFANRLINIFIMFHLVCFGYLLFRANSMSQVGAMMLQMVTDFRVTTFAWSAIGLIIFYAAPLFIYEFWLDSKQDLLELTQVNWLVRGLAYSYCAFMLLFFPPPVSNVFIYFQF